MKNRFLFVALAALLVMTMSSCVFFVPEHEHQFGDEWKYDATHHWHSCTGEICGEISDKAEHSGGTATETEKAKCEVCGAEYGELKSHEHAYGEWQTKTPATCTSTGVEMRTCACGAEEVRDIAKLDHSFTNEVADEKYLATANCEEQATYFKSCSCGAKGTETFAYGEVIAHAYGEWQTKTPATCDDAEVEYRACSCGKEETRVGDAALGHNMVNNSDDTHHWTECDREGCDEATEKVAHSATSISAVCNMANPMESMTVKASDLTVTAVCACGKSYTVTDVTLENATLALGENTVTVKYGEASTTVKVVAAEFNMVIDGSVVDDTYVYSASGSQESNYVGQKELSANGNNFRVLLRYNFSDLLASPYYQMYKDSAKVQFTFTMTTGAIDNTTPVTFKVYPVTEGRSGADFADLTWKSYNNETYAFGWGNAYGLIEKIAESEKLAVADGKITITVAYRELEEFIDANGNAVFVFAIWKSSTKVGSMENDTEANRPTVQIILNDDHVHAYIEKVADADHLVSANCGEKAIYYYSCSCGQNGAATFEHGDVIEHEIQTKYDETNHWTECVRDGCDEATEPVAHFGGTATETEQATCEGCGQKYGGTASHVHVYGEWQTRTAATCDEAELEFRKCACGAEETQTGEAALGHNMETKYDAESHWTECSRCDEATASEAHSGGTATETEKAICSTCGQPYGDLKEPEKQEYTINGAVVADTDINSSTKDKDRSKNEQIYLYSSAARGFIVLDLKDILNSADFESAKANGKFQLTFTIAGNESDINNTKFLLQVANPTYTDADGATQYTAGIPAAGITWNSAHVESGAYYNALYLGNMKYIVGNSDSGKLLTQTDKVIYTADANGGAGTVTYELTYDDIKDYICMDTDSDYYGQIVFKFRAKGTATAASKTLYYASSETATPPTVKFVYEK
ncbi:MAG: hypothetical protein J6K85_02805 [Clostridia bacterium]|nr:hypothetical protein [Clostridia bacterium]